MTSISMNAGNSAYFASRAHRRPPLMRQTVAPNRAPIRLGAGTAKRGLASAGSFTLALVPFSLLAWMFVAG